MPFVKDDPNINKLDTLPEKFTKEFVDYVCHLYANNTSVLEMSEILNTPQNTIKKYLSNGVVWFNKLNVHDLSAIRKQSASVVGQLKCFIKMLMVRLKVRSFTFQRTVKIER